MNVSEVVGEAVGEHRLPCFHQSGQLKFKSIHQSIPPSLIIPAQECGGGGPEPILAATRGSPQATSPVSGYIQRQLCILKLTFPVYLYLFKKKKNDMKKQTKDIRFVVRIYNTGISLQDTFIRIELNSIIILAYYKKHIKYPIFSSIFQHTPTLYGCSYISNIM